MVTGQEEAMKIGYLRVSTDEQNPQRQIDGLQAVCDELHIEKLSATSRKRPIYSTVMRKLKRDDTLVIWEISRAYRSVSDAIREGEKLTKRGVHLQIGTTLYDLSIPEIECMYIVQAAFSQLEVRRLQLRTREGMNAARNNGKHVGRLKNDVLRAAHAAVHADIETVSSVAAKIGCSEETLRKGFKRLELE